MAIKVQREAEKMAGMYLYYLDSRLHLRERKHRVVKHGFC